MLIAYVDRGVVQIKDTPMEETRVPIYSIESLPKAKKIMAEATKIRSDITWEIVGKGAAYCVRESSQPQNPGHLRKPKSGETITLNDGKKVKVLYSAEGVVHRVGDQNRVTLLSDLRADENDPTNWFYTGDTHQYKATFGGQEITYEGTRPISGDDKELLRKYVVTGQKDENARKELERRGIRVLNRPLDHQEV